MVRSTTQRLFTQTAAVQRVARGDLCLDALGVEGPTVLVAIVAVVGLDDCRPCRRPLSSKNRPSLQGHHSVMD